MSTKKTYQSWVFACFYFGVFLFMAAVWYFLPAVPTWAVMILIGFGILGLPWLRARVEIDDEGITQQILRNRSVKWADIISWERVAHPDSDGPDTITITTQAGSFGLNHNCVYGERLDFVESELRRRIAQPGAAPNGGPVTRLGNTGVTEGPPSVS